MCEICEDSLNLEPPGIIYHLNVNELNYLSDRHFKFRELILLKERINMVVFCNCLIGKNLINQRKLKDIVKNNNKETTYITFNDLVETVPNHSLVKLLKGDYK